jgi:hypothetical protein
MISRHCIEFVGIHHYVGCSQLFILFRNSKKIVKGILMINIQLISHRNIDIIGRFSHPKDVVPFSSLCPIYKITTSI